MILHCDVWNSNSCILNLYGCVYIWVGRRCFTKGPQLSFIYKGSYSIDSFTALTLKFKTITIDYVLYFRQS